MTTARSRQGVTLVEVLVVSLIMGVLAGATLSIMTIHNRELNQVVTRSRLQMSAETMVEQIGRDVRTGSHVMAAGETWSSASAYAAATVSEINILDNAGAAKAYRVSGGKLQYHAPGGAYADFNVGGTDIQVSTANPFSITSDRKQLSVQLALSLTYKGTSFQVPAKGGSFRCRN